MKSDAPSASALDPRLGRSPRRYVGTMDRDRLYGDKPSGWRVIGTGFTISWLRPKMARARTNLETEFDATDPFPLSYLDPLRGLGPGGTSHPGERRGRRQRGLRSRDRAQDARRRHPAPGGDRRQGRDPPDLLQGESVRRRSLLRPPWAGRGPLQRAGPRQQPSRKRDRRRDHPGRADRPGQGRPGPRRLERHGCRPPEESLGRFPDALHEVRRGRDRLRAPAEPDDADLGAGRRRDGRRRRGRQCVRLLARADRGCPGRRDGTPDVRRPLEGRGGDLRPRGARPRPGDRGLHCCGTRAWRTGAGRSTRSTAPPRGASSGT